MATFRVDDVTPGTVEDWRKIRARIDSIVVFGLEKWCRSLAPIADQFVRAAAGDVDTAFWQRVYNPVDAYGGEVITGWAARFYPYLTGQATADVPNPLLDLRIGEPREVTVDSGFYSGPGIRSTAVPATLSQAVVNVNDRVGQANRVVALHAGLVGIAQDEDGALRPVAGWHLAEARVRIDDVIDRIVRDHDAEPPRPAHVFDLGADVAAVYRRIGSATLFGGAWRLRSVVDRRQVFDRDGLPIITLIDLADGRSIAAAQDFEAQTVHWVLCRVEAAGKFGFGVQLVDDPADIPVFGTSLALLLDAALDSGGDIAQLETGRLDELDARASR